MNEISYSYVVRVKDKTYNVMVRPSGEGRFRVLVEDTELDVFVETGQPIVRTLPSANLVMPVESKPPVSETKAPTESGTKKPETGPGVVVQAPVPTAAPIAPVAAGGAVIASPIPGKVLKVLVNPGDAVSPGKLVATLESMKMEVEVFSDKSGKVKEVKARPGDFVNVGDPLIVLD